MKRGKETDMIKKIALILTFAAMVFCFAACGDTSSNTENTTTPNAPYLGFAPDTLDSFDRAGVFECAMEGDSVQLLRYDAGENNKAIIRIEESTKDGKWEEVQKKGLMLTENVNKGYMASVDNFDGKIAFNTNLIEYGDGNASYNIAKFDYPKAESYGTRNYFGKVEGLEDMSEEEILAVTNDMDMTSKKTILMYYDEPPMVKDGKLVSLEVDDAEEAEVNDIYNNKDGIFTDFYKENGMTAVTIEFVKDETLADAPCLYTKDGKLMYCAGPYDSSEVRLMKSTKEGKWKQVGEENYLSFIRNAPDKELKVECENGKVTVFTDKIGNGKTSFKNLVEIDLPDHNGEIIPNAYANGHMSVVKAMPLILAFDENGGKAIDGIGAVDFYQNKDGKYSDIYKDNTFYVVTFKAGPN